MVSILTNSSTVRGKVREAENLIENETSGSHEEGAIKRGWKKGKQKKEQRRECLTMTLLGAQVFRD